jgi:hypothetical protein
LNLKIKPIIKAEKIHICVHAEVEIRLHAFLILLLDKGELSASRPGLFAPEKTFPVLTEYESVWAPGAVWTFSRRRNVFLLLGIETRVVQDIIIVSLT